MENLTLFPKSRLYYTNSLYMIWCLHYRDDPATAAISAKMKHLDFLRSSLHSKWAKVERRRNVLSPGSSFMEELKEVSSVYLNVFMHS